MKLCQNAVLGSDGEKLIEFPGVNLHQDSQALTITWDHY